MALSAAPEKLTLWAVSDGRAGIESQVLGLAEAVARLTPAEVVPKRLRFNGLYRLLPAPLQLSPRQALAAGSDRLDPPWPDIWIGAGRVAVTFAMCIRKWSRGRTFVVQVQDPRWPARLFDLVIPPRHDRVEGEAIFPITGSPHRVTAERLAAEAPAFAAAIDPLPKPRVAVLIGGKSKSHDLAPARAIAMAEEIAAEVGRSGGSILATFSRRTPAAARDLMAHRLKQLPGIVWEGDGPNPYFAFLARADHILVTEDSINMAAEAASTGKPVHILAMDGGSRKFGRFHDELRAYGASRPFTRLESWTYKPLHETARAAAEVLRRYRARPIE
ncbi:MAG: mitochondrial fission ELM1 family protein [Caulobacteraceae bacterium]|nr:mitochondrial fission ELM1 family protein [Caulobacteraceae bacterium]